MNASTHRYEMFAEAFDALSSDLSRGTAGNAYVRLVDLAVVCIEGCDYAGMTDRRQGKKSRSLANTDPIAALVDGIEYTLDQGPCLTSADTDEAVYVPVLADDTRFPDFRDAVLAQTPVRSSIALPLSTGVAKRAMNLYGSTTGILGSEERAADAAVFGAHARAAMRQAEAQAQAENLLIALESSREIGSAIGILKALRKVTDDQAFELLLDASHRMRTKVRDVAQHVNDTGTLPDLN